VTRNLSVRLIDTMRVGLDTVKSTGRMVTNAVVDGQHQGAILCPDPGWKLHLETALTETQIQHTNLIKEQNPSFANPSVLPQSCILQIQSACAVWIPKLPRCSFVGDSILTANPRPPNQ